LSKEEVEKMKKDATEHAAEDKKKKEAVEVKNQADSMIFQTRKQINEMGDKISADQKSKLESEIKKVEDAIASNNTDSIKSATEALTKVWNDIASMLYQQTGSQQQQAGGAHEQTGAKGEQGKEGKEEAQDASYEVVDEEKDKNKKE
jgi:molecular chaperone DnaK